MATLKGKTLFFVTSPRSPLKMRPEIKELVDGFSGEIWNNETQIAFMQRLVETDEFQGTGNQNDPAFSARDRVTRGPKSLGFVDLKPVISLTDAGRAFLNDETVEEALLRQLLKFQFPSPYHKISRNTPVVFSVKPYLEIFRLIHTLEQLSRDEIMLFGLQLTSYELFEEIVDSIRNFRSRRTNSNANYQSFLHDEQRRIISEVYSEDIELGRTNTRESRDACLDNFIRTKAQTMRDYTDACIRYLRATGLVSVSRGWTLSILPEKQDEVEFFLRNINRRPEFINDDDAFKANLFNDEIPVLYNDNRVLLEQKINDLGIIEQKSIAALNNAGLKNLLQRHIQKRKEDNIAQQITLLKSQRNAEEIVNTFSDITTKKIYDPPLMFEWNTWRAMTVLNGGNIIANLRFDDNGEPMTTAAGNMADIVCEYDEFLLAVEVTLQSGARQYETEGEPVARHLARLRDHYNDSRPAYCFFIAPKINEASIAHFYALHHISIDFYGGYSAITPLELSVFEAMVKQACNVSEIPTSERIQAFCRYCFDAASQSEDEKVWFENVRTRALNWLS